MQLWFAAALTPNGWARHVRVHIDGGKIVALQVGVRPEDEDERFDIGLPGMPNLHSHAFQRGMAGLTEAPGSEADSFWSWRQLMYRFLDVLSPDDMESIAGLAYAEMLESGFTRVGEFHYVHHQSDGSPYKERAELLMSVAAAAEATGIALTLLPVFYAQSGFGGQPPLAAQRRLISSVDDFASLVEGAQRATNQLKGGNVGIAPHSLRAVTPDQLKAILPLANGMPIHIHIAEQTQEVEDCLSWSGQRPVAWLLDHLEIDTRWCLIHATHVNQTELNGIAKVGAVVGLCPVTEANLGDGIFPAREFLNLGGRIGTGSDSNIRISLTDEISILEYGQRLTLRSRNVLADRPLSTGRTVFDRIHSGGLQALGQAYGSFATGHPADIVALRSALSDRVTIRGIDTILDEWVFSGRLTRVDSVWRAGKRLVREGIHVNRDSLQRRFLRTLERLF